MQLDNDSGQSGRIDDCGVASLGGGADSSNRPWETDAIRISADRESRLPGLLAIGAAAILALAWLTLPQSPPLDGGSASYLRLAEASRWSLLLSHCLGVLLLPLYGAGYWLAARGLRGAGAWRSRPVFLLGSCMAAIAGAHHGLLAVLTRVAWHGGANPERAARLLAQAGAYSEPLQGLALGLGALASAWFAIGVVSGSTRFPRWLALANPLVLGAALAAVLATPASFHLAHLLFFCLIVRALRQAPGG